MALQGRELRSTIDQEGRLTLSLENVTVTDPIDDELIVRIEATPINPSDLGSMLGPADTTTASQSGGSLTFTVPPARLPSVQGRVGQSIAVGNEGAGTVISAGPNAHALEGKRVGMFGGAMYADYRKISSREVLVLPDGASAADGASLFVNPLTALGFIETMRRENHRGLIHTAAASSLGQMLQKICHADDIPLINIVRSEGQADLLRRIGAKYVLNSSAPDFAAELTDAVSETGATVAFDAVGGGSLGNTIVQCMERAAARNMKTYNRYGSDVFKQLYIYGMLDTSPTMLNRPTFGSLWSISGWLLFPFLRKAGDDVRKRLQQRVLDDLTTTFASHYAKTITLEDMLNPEIIRACNRKSTGEKYLIDPSLR
jgi:NADPH:quinone reductase